MAALRSLIITLAVGTALSSAAPAAWGQGQGGPASATRTRIIQPEEFLRLAYSSAALQEQAAKLAASRETRPEVKSYATTAVDFRAGLLKRIATFAQEHQLPLPPMKEFEHRVIIENLEPLDYLALSRRYAEVQVQAVEQELGIYRAASQSPNQELKAFADQLLPELERQRDGAQKMYEAVKP